MFPDPSPSHDAKHHQIEDGFHKPAWPFAPSSAAGRSRHKIDEAISDVHADGNGVRITECYHGERTLQTYNNVDSMKCWTALHLICSSLGLLTTIGLAVSALIGFLLCGWSTRRIRYIGSKTCEDGISTRIRGHVVDRTWPMVPSYFNFL